MIRTTGVLLLAASLWLFGCQAEVPSGAQSTAEQDPPEEQEPGDAEGTAAAADIEPLRIRHSQSLAFGIPFAVLEQRSTLEGLDVDTYVGPDVLRSILINAEAELTAVPTPIAANLHNRGVDLRLAAVVVWSLFWLIGPDGTPADWEELRGETVLVPYRNDPPDLVFQRLLLANGLTPGEDVRIEYFSQPSEVVGNLVSGAGTWAVLQEHIATAALAQANEAGQGLGRVLDLQEEWAAAFGTSPRIPLAGVVVPTPFAEERGEDLAALLDDLEDAVAVANAAEQETLDMLSDVFDLPPELIRSVIPRLSLEVVPASEAQDDLEAYFTALADLSPEIIGGQLPDASLYLADPR